MSDIMKAVINYLKSVGREFSQIVWPPRRTVLIHTVLVVIISLITALILYLIDLILIKLLNGLLIYFK